jgi:hypothetical protein
VCVNYFCKERALEVMMLEKDGVRENKKKTIEEQIGQNVEHPGVNCFIF